MKEFLLWWVIGSYVIGLFIFAMEYGSNKKNPHVLRIATIFTAVAPLTAWHAVLHYMQLGYCKLRKRPVKFWI